MTDDAVRRRRNRRTLIQAVIGFGLLALTITAGLYLTSDAFAERVRLRLITELERITGARVEMKSFRWNLSKLEVEAHDVTLHGLEAEGEVPYAHVDRLYARAKILSLFGGDFGLRALVVERPVIHLIVYPDGSTNQPVPKVKREGKGDPVGQLFRLQIGSLELRQGMLLLNDRRIPFDFSGNDVSAGMTYALLADRYDGDIRIGQMDAKYKDFLPLRSSVEVQFGLSREAAEVKALKWASASKRSTLEASGRMTDFNDPKLELAYNVALDLAELGGIARAPELRAGKLVVNGQGQYTTAEFSAAGKLYFQNVTWAQPGMNVPALNAAANYSVTRDRLSLSGLNGRLFGGTVTGEAEVRHWSEAAEKTGDATRAAGTEPQRGSASLVLTGVDVGAVAAALSTRGLPLDKIRPAGTAGGTVKVQWLRTPRHADAAIALEVAPPPAPSPEQLPINARLDAVYRGASQTLDVAALNLATRRTRLDATGTLGSERARLNVALNTTDLGEFEPAIAALRAGRLPLDVQGRASFNGTVRGRFAAPTIAGALEVSDFDTALDLAPAPAPGAAPAPRRGTRVHWDRLSAQVEYGPALAAVRNARLERGPAQIHFDLSAALQKGKFTERTPLDLRLVVRDAELRDLQTLAGYDYPVSGRVVADLRLAGTQNDLRGGGTLQLTGGAIYGEPYRSLRAELRMAGREAELHDIVFAQNGARIAGSAAYDLGSEAFRFDLRGDGFQLAEFRRLQRPRFTTQGRAEFHARGSGTLAEPVINATLAVRDLVLNGEPAGSLDAQAVTRGADMQLTARSRFQDAELTVDGNVHLRGDFPADVRLRFADIDIDPLLRVFLQGRVTGHSRIAGDATLRGPLKQPRLLNVEGVIARFSAEIEKLPITSAGPIRFAMADQVVRVDGLHLTGPETDFTAGGSVNLAGARELDLRADGRVNLVLLQTFNPDLMSYGETTLSVQVAGTMARPDVRGQIEIRKGGVSLIDLPNGLSDINGTLLFNENRLNVQNLTAKSGGGTLSITGFIRYTHGLYFDLRATSSDIRLRYPPGVSAMANADLRFMGTTANSLLTGDVTVTRFGLNPRFDFALYLARSKQPPSLPEPGSPLNNLRLDVHIVSTPELHFETSLAKVSANADLRLRGTAAHPVVLGRVNVLQGDVFFNGTKYHLERGDITFTNPVRIEPVINVEATARVREYDITLGFHGTMDKLSTTYRSDPPLPTADVIALLALGRTREESVLQPQPERNLSEVASNAILGQALNAAISSRAQRLFGISRIKIDPQVGGPESNPNARVTIEQQVSDKVTLTFITNLAQSAQQIIQVEYNVNRQVSIIAVRDQNGVVGFDVKLRQRIR